MENQLPTTNLHPSIKAYIDKFPAMVEKMVAQTERLKLADELEAIFPQFISRNSTCEWTDRVWVNMKCESIDQVTPMLRYITKIKGLHQISEPYKADLSIGYRFQGFDLDIQFSGKCRMVKVGEETITRDIMEMQCGDAPESTEAPATEAEAPETPKVEPENDPVFA